MKNLLLAALVSALCLCTAMTAKADTAINIADTGGNTSASTMYIDDTITLAITFDSIDVPYSDNVYTVSLTTTYDDSLLSLINDYNNYIDYSSTDNSGTIVQTSFAPDISGEFMDLSTLVFSLVFQVIDASNLGTAITVEADETYMESYSADLSVGGEVTTGFEGSSYVIGELLEEQQEEPSDVPEPGTLALALLGLGAVSFVRRKSI